MINRYSTNTSFLDLLLNALICFAALFCISFVMISVDNKENNIKSNAEFIITLTWNSEIDDDIDLWVEDPEGRIVSFRNREDCLMHLDRDDQGLIRDAVLTQNGEVIVNENKETITIRGIIPGEYVVNAFMYDMNNPDQTNAVVELLKINPFSIVTIKQLKFEYNGQELTAFRFTIDNDGTVIDTNELYKRLFQ